MRAHDLIYFKLHKQCQFLRIVKSDHTRLDEDGGGGKYSQWNLQIDGEVDGQEVVRLQHSHTNNFLRIYDDGNKIDVAGIGGKLTKFKVHKTGINSTNRVKFESIEFPGKYIAVKPNHPNGEFIGIGGEFCIFECFYNGRALRAEQVGGSSYTHKFYFNTQSMQVVLCGFYGRYLRFVHTLSFAVLRIHC